MERSDHTLAAFCITGWPGGSSLGGASADAAGLLCGWTTSRYIRALARVCLYVVSERAPTRHVPPTSESPSLAGKPGGGGERGTGAARRDSCSGGGLAGRTCCCRWLWRVLLAISRMLCSAAVSGFVLSTESDLRRREKLGMERSDPTPAVVCITGLPGGSCTGGAPTAAAAGCLFCWNASRYIRALARVCYFVLNPKNSKIENLCWSL